MATWLAGFLAVILLVINRQYKDILSGMAAIFFWLIFAASAFVISAGDVTDIYFYFFFGGLGVAISLLIDLLNYGKGKPEQNDSENADRRGGLDKMRARMGWRSIRR